jgi:hypothetical protein
LLSDVVPVSQPAACCQSRLCSRTGIKGGLLETLPSFLPTRPLPPRRIFFISPFLPRLSFYYILAAMVRLVSRLLPLLAAATSALAAIKGGDLIGRDVSIAPRHVSPDVSVEAVLLLDVEFETSASVIVGLGALSAELDLDIEVGKGGLDLGVDVGLGLPGRKGLSVDVCLRALLAKLQLNLDGEVTCTGPPISTLKQPIKGRSSVPCNCNHPDITLELIVPDIVLDVQASYSFIAAQELVFVFTKHGKQSKVVASKPKMEWPEPKKCKLGYEQPFKC